MFVQDFKVVERPFGEVVASLAVSTRDLLGVALSVACAESERIRAILWSDDALRFLGEVVVQPEAARWYPGRMVQPFSWVELSGSASGARLDADLEVSPLGLLHTVLEIRGTVTLPPLQNAQRDGPLSQHLVALALRAALEQVASILSLPSPTLVSRHGVANGLP